MNDKFSNNPDASSPVKNDESNKGQNKIINISQPKITEEEVMSLDNDLAELRQKYIEAKKSREIVAQNEKHIENKMKLLNKKEIEAQRRLELSHKNHKDREDIKEYNKLQKERLEALKKKKEEDLKIKRDKANIQKNKIKISLSGWRLKNAERHKGEGNKKFSEKKIIEKEIQEGRERVTNKNKYSHDQIKMSFIQSEQKKKEEELEKKLKRKKELEELINQELNKKKHLQDRIDNYNAESVKINENIKDMDIKISEQLGEVHNKMQNTNLINRNISKTPCKTKTNLDKNNKGQKSTKLMKTTKVKENNP